jgi:ribosomal protein S18 acetylase RimI-like enzyme
MPHESDAIAALIRLSFASQPVVTDPPPSARLETGDSITAHFAAGGGGAVAGEIVAVLLWAEKEGGLYVGRLSVHPAARRLGLARRLIEVAQLEARARALPRIFLLTRLPLLDNRRLFAAFGFIETAFHSHAGYDAPTSVEMEKRLV